MRRRASTTPLGRARTRGAEEGPAAEARRAGARSRGVLQLAADSVRRRRWVRRRAVASSAIGRAVADALPRGTLVVFEESSHALPLEEPDRFQDAVAAFVTDWKPTAS